MHRNKQIAIILPDTLQSIGLQSMLIDYFPPVEISHYPTFEAFSTSGNDTFDYYFTNAALFVLYADFFLPYLCLRPLKSRYRNIFSFYHKYQEKRRKLSDKS